MNIELWNYENKKISVSYFLGHPVALGARTGKGLKQEVVSKLLISKAYKVIVPFLLLAYIEQLRSYLLNWTSGHALMTIISAGQASN